MLTLHIGMPKTGTTACQRVLSNAPEALAARGFEYPLDFRNAEGIGHHGIAAELINRKDLQGPHVQGFLTYLTRKPADKILISSEAFINALDRARLATFIQFIDECCARVPTRIVLSLRRIDSLTESMYLHNIKTGNTKADLADYVRVRGSWAMNLFRGLVETRTRPGVSEMTIVKYEPNNEFIGRFFTAMGLPYQEMPELADVPRENIRLGLKAQTVLRHFELFNEQLDSPVERRQMVHHLALGKLTFDDDTYSYKVLPFEDAQRLHAQALEASRETGFTEYDTFFRDEKIAARECVLLDPSNVTPADISKLNAFFQQL